MNTGIDSDAAGYIIAGMFLFGLHMPAKDA